MQKCKNVQDILAKFISLGGIGNWESRCFCKGDHAKRESGRVPSIYARLLTEILMSPIVCLHDSC